MLLLLITLSSWSAWSTRHKARFEKREAEREAKRLDKQLIKEGTVYIGNPILEYIISRFNIVIWGGLGVGKTLMANAIVKYIVEKQAYYDYRNRRMLKYTNPQYLRDLQKLDEAQKLNVYSEISLEDPWSGYTANDFWPYITQHKKVTENGVYFADEIGTRLGKDNYQEKAKDPDMVSASESARFARQDANVRFVATEQAEDNIWKPIREKGFLSIHMLSTVNWIVKKGKSLKWLRDTWLNIMPGLLTLNISEILATQFGKRNKFKAFCKLLLPAYFLLPKPYYIKRIEIAKDIKFRYTKFKALFELEGERHYLIFTNQDIYIYNTRGHKELYNAKFDANGNRKFVKEEQNG